MRVYRPGWLKTSIASHLRRMAWTGTFDGHMTTGAASYMDECTGFDQYTGSFLIFTRDIGHHTSGWFKNPDYERCFHLSISFREPSNIDQPAAYDEKIAREWIDAFFGDDARYLWAETAKSPEGIELGVMHWRCFTDEHWQPILPRGEVYSTAFTELGWKSFSEQYPTEDRKEPSILHAG